MTDETRRQRRPGRSAESLWISPNSISADHENVLPGMDTNTHTHYWSRFNTSHRHRGPGLNYDRPLICALFKPAAHNRGITREKQQGSVQAESRQTASSGSMRVVNVVRLTPSDERIHAWQSLASFEWEKRERWWCLNELNMCHVSRRVQTPRWPTGPTSSPRRQKKTTEILRWWCESVFVLWGTFWLSIKEVKSERPKVLTSLLLSREKYSMYDLW